jgi:CPA2 family monovalent cation:H+ antiporter-2
MVGGNVSFFRTYASMTVLMIVAVVFRFRLRERVLKLLWEATGKQNGLFVLGLLSLCLIFGFLSRYMGLSMLYGAFLFGSAISGNHYVTHIESSVETIGTFFSCLYFASIGMVLKLGWISSNLFSVTTVLFHVFAAKVLVMIPLLLIAGFRFRKVVLATLSILPISEFSMIYMSRAYKSGAAGRKLYLEVLASTAISMMIEPLLQRIVMSQSRPLSFPRSAAQRAADLSTLSVSKDEVALTRDETDILNIRRVHHFDGETADVDKEYGRTGDGISDPDPDDVARDIATW